MWYKYRGQVMVDTAAVHCGLNPFLTDSCVKPWSKNLITNYVKRPSVHDFMARKVIYDLVASNNYAV